MPTLPRWFWPLAVACFLLLLILCLSRHIPTIQRDLLLRSTSALQAQGINLENVLFKGRDAQLYGTVASQDVAQQAINSVADVYGVRKVSSFLNIDPNLASTLGMAAGGTAALGTALGLLPALSSINMVGAALDSCNSLSADERAALQREFDQLAGELPDERFGVGSIEVSPALASYLDRVVALMTRHDKTPIRIVGYTDSALPSEFNECLSLGRAASVYQYLVQKGVNPDCLMLEAAGDKQAMASNETKEGRMLNRRIEFKIEEVK